MIDIFSTFLAPLEAELSEGATHQPLSYAAVMEGERALPGRELRGARVKTPIIVLSAVGDEIDKVLLLEIGAEPNPAVEDGFPPLIAALTTARSRPGSQARPDALEVLALLLDAGSDPDQRGINDYTPLHWAIGDRNEDAVRLLLERGADPSLRTRIDDCETPRELAAAMGETGLAELLRQAEGSRSAPPSRQP